MLLNPTHQLSCCIIWKNKKKTAAWSYSLGRAWGPRDWQDSKANGCSHTSTQTVYPVRDELHPQRKAINGSLRARSQVASSPIRCAFYRFTLVFSSDRSPLLMLAYCQPNSARERVILFWGDSLTLISPSKPLLQMYLWKWNLAAQFLILKILWNMIA